MSNPTPLYSRDATEEERDAAIRKQLRQNDYPLYLVALLPIGMVILSVVACIAAGACMLLPF